MSIEDANININITCTAYGRAIGHAVGKVCIWLGMKAERATWVSMQFMIMSIRVDGGKRQWVWLGGR